MKTIIILFMAFVFAAGTLGCSRVETYGEHISNRNITAIKDILVAPQMYDGKRVTVKGKIVLECETGCWFNIKDGEAVMYTDLSPAGFAIPQNVGRNAVVEGNIMVKDGKPTLVAKGAEIK